MVVDPAREAFLAERKTGIGGSDIASVFSIGYGCRRRLWYDKRGVEPDFPREENGPMALGKLLESYFADHYARITGRQVAVREVAYHPEHSELLVHADRMVYDPARPAPGVLEIKSMGRGAYFNVKRKGLPEDYILQLQHGMLVTGATWGSFAIGCRDFGVSRPQDLLWWDLEREEEVHKEILREGPIFWAQVENGPAPDALGPDDARCQECAFSVSCQGNALQPAVKADDYEVDESLAALVREYVDRRELKKEAELLLDDTKAELQARLGDRTMVRAGGAKVQYFSYTKKTYTVPEHSERPLRIYPPKGR